MELARQTLVWVVRRLSQRTTGRHAALIQVKNADYAWRQAIFCLSFCEPADQVSQMCRLPTWRRLVRAGIGLDPAKG